MNKALTFCSIAAIVAMTTGCSNTPTKVELNDEFFQEFVAATDSLVATSWEDLMWQCYNDQLVGCMNTAILTNKGSEREVVDLMFCYIPFRELMFNDWDGFCQWGFLAGTSQEYQDSILDIFIEVKETWWNQVNPETYE